MGFDGLGGDGRVGFLGEGGDQCDLFKREWVWDEKYQLYQLKYC